MDFVIVGVLSALSAFTLVMLSPWRRKFLGYVWFFDVTISLGFVFAFLGTFSGVVTGFIAGLAFSGLMRAARWYLGAEQLRRDGLTFRWEETT